MNTTITSELRELTFEPLGIGGRGQELGEGAVSREEGGESVPRDGNARIRTSYLTVS